MKAAASSLICLSMLLLPLAGCRKQPVATPRPQAYPRPALYPQSYQRVAVASAVGPDSLTVNDSARVLPVADGWFDILYPAYGIKVNCTLAPYSPEAMNNRLERIDRNLGGAAAQVLSLPAGMLVVSTSALRTPVQLLAADSASWMLSAVAVSDFPASAAADSVAPIIDAVAADMTRLLENLPTKPNAK